MAATIHTRREPDPTTAARPLRGRGASGAGPVGFAVAGLVLAVAIGLPFTGISFYYLQVGILVFWFAMVSTGWSILGGYAGLHSIGHAAFVGTGAYTSTLLYVNFDLSPWLGMLAGMGLAVGIALLIGYPCFRFGIRGDYFALVTVALGLVAYELVNGLPTITRGSQGIAVPYAGTSPANFQFADRTVFYFIILAMWLAVVVLAYWLRRSRFGVQLIALRDDEAAAARGGINVSRRKLTAYAISAAIGAVAGTFYAQFFLFIDPSAVLFLSLSIQIVLMAVLGGVNSYLGGTLGALLLVPLGQYLSVTLAGTPGVDLVIYGVILVLLMLYMPYGILGLLRRSPRWRRVIGW